MYGSVCVRCCVYTHVDIRMHARIHVYDVVCVDVVVLLSCWCIRAVATAHVRLFMNVLYDVGVACACMRICACMCICVCVYVCVCCYVYMYVRRCTCVCVCSYVRLCVCIHDHVGAYTCSCVCVFGWVYMRM